MTQFQRHFLEMSMILGMVLGVGVNASARLEAGVCDSCGGEGIRTSNVGALRRIPVSAIAPGCEVVGKGSASYYGSGDGFAGKKTASGKRMDPNANIVAHKTLPFGTKLILRDPATGKIAKATVEDRGPYVKGRIVDMSPRVFKQFASLSRGVLSRIEVWACK